MDTNTEKMMTPNNKNVPNNCYRWLVLAGIVLINVSNQAITSTFGLLFGDHLRQMEQEIIGAALITNLNALALNFSGFFIGPAIKKFGSRKVAFIGCSLTTSGLIICAISSKLWHMILGYSILIGIGLGLLAPSTFLAINSYFTTKRGCAVGISLAGTGFGQMILPHIIRILLEHFGYRSTVLLIAGFALNGLVGACLFRPIELKMKKLQKKNKNIKDIKLLLEVNDDNEKEIMIKQKNQIHNVNDNDDSADVIKHHHKNDYEINIEKIRNNKKSQQQQQRQQQEQSSLSSSSTSSNKLCKEILKKICKAMDLELLKDSTFCNIIVGISLMYTVTASFTMLFPYFLQLSVGLTKKETALCMSILAGCDMFCRLLLPILTDKFKMSYRFVFLLGSFGLLLSRTILTESTDLYILLIMSGLYGSAKSATVLNANLTIADYCNKDKLPSALGLNMILKGILMMSIGQFLGWLRDYTKSYTICLHAQNLLIIVLITLWISEYLYKNIKKNYHHNNEFLSHHKQKMKNTTNNNMI